MKTLVVLLAAFFTVPAWAFDADVCSKAGAAMAKLEKAAADAVAHGDKVAPVAEKFLKDGTISNDESDELFMELVAVTDALDLTKKAAVELDGSFPAGTALNLQSLHYRIGAFTTGVLAKFGKRLTLLLIGTSSCKPGENDFYECQARVASGAYVDRAKQTRPYDEFKSGIAQDVLGLKSYLEKELCPAKSATRERDRTDALSCGGA